MGKILTLQTGEKKAQNRFGGNKKTTYLCTRFWKKKGRLNGAEPKGYKAKEDGKRMKHFLRSNQMITDKKTATIISTRKKFFEIINAKPKTR